MLSLNQITKDYVSGDSTVPALKGISLCFRKNEFVSILGASGCGKTTLLNIIGGLDHYTSGDLKIAGKSTKEYTSRDWDTYRNHSIGFVFQSYNLIPHQTVLANVELALTISGVSKAERKKRAIAALESVGLGDQLHKKPTQMSGGQMQRVAIARALVNNPEILLADEPTGALDSQTSIQVMEILKEVSADRLVIMVTHNPELAEQYSSRIIRLHDGEVIGDTEPFSEKEEAAELEAIAKEQEKRPEVSVNKGRKKKSSMSLPTAFSLSLNNLMTKKGRTFLTAFAGSIGIIGIALILSLSNGINNYIEIVQEDTLSSYPIVINAEQTDMSSMISTMMGQNAENKEPHENDAVYSNPIMYQLMNSFVSPEIQRNNLTLFKEYLESQQGDISEYVNAIQYGYDVSINAYVKDEKGKFVKSDIMGLFSQMAGEDSLSSSYFSMVSSMSSTMAMFDVWDELIPGKNGEPVNDMVKNQYDLVAGDWPKSKDEIVIVLSEKNELPDLVLYTLGLTSGEELSDAFFAVMSGKEIEYSTGKWSYDDILNITFQLITAADVYQYDEKTGLYVDISDNEAMMNALLNKGLTLRISGIVKPNPDATATSLSGYICYTSELTEYIVDQTAKSPVVLAQKAPENANRNVITGLPFEINEQNQLTDAEKAQAFIEYIAGLTDAKKAEIFTAIVTTPSDAYLDEQIEQYISAYGSYTVEELIDMIADQYADQLGYSPDIIRATFAGYSKDEIITMIKETVKKYIGEVYKKTQNAMVIDPIINTPTDEELVPFEKQILSQLTSRFAKQYFIQRVYTTNTAIPSEKITEYLSSLSDDELDSLTLTVVREQAAVMYKQYSAVLQSDEVKNQKLAAALDALTAESTEEERIAYYDEYVLKETVSGKTLDEVLEELGVCDLASPDTITIYPIDFKSKEQIVAIKDQYNKDQIAAGHEENTITYTDFVQILMSSVTVILNAISGVLIAFVSISLVVSSIMIGIITYISVLERTKEIGVLRAIGASKRDISRVFNAETLIVGFTAGAIGIIFTLLLCLPINLIIHAFSGISTINAALPWIGGLVLVALSMLLTFIAGLIPSRIAAKKDPVVALRSE